MLRGPQGTLYGSAAEGGLVKYVINKPKYDRYEGRLQVGGEGIDGGGVGGSVRGVVNVPLVEGKLALRASGFYYDTPGYIQNPLLGRSDLGGVERYGGRVALAFKASDTLSFRITALRQKQTSDAQGAVEVLGSHASPATPPANFLDIANGGVLTRRSLIPENSSREFSLYDGHIDWALPWVDVTSVTSYGEIETHYSLDNTSFAIGGPLTLSGLFGARYGQPIVVEAQPNFLLKKFNQEVRFSSKPNTHVLGLPVELQAGFYYTKEDVDYSAVSNARSAANTSVILTSPMPLGNSLFTASYEEYSGFGEANVHLSPKLTLTGGVRYASNNQSVQTSVQGGFLAGASIVRPTVLSSEDKVTWNGALRYALTDHASVYTRVASGYRPGGPVIPGVGAPPDLPTSYRADNTVNYEVGLKGDFFDRRLSVDVAGFWIDWDDVQINSFFTSTTTGIRVSVTGNGGTAVSRGFEYSVAFTPFRGWQISAVGSYDDAKLTQDAPAFGGRSGDRLPYVPRFTNTLNLDYSTRVADDYRVFAGGSWQYEGARFSDFGTNTTISNHFHIPDYNTLNLQAGVEHGRYLAELYIRNINDERGITRYQGGNGANFTDLAGVITPRTIGGRITARF